VEDIGNLLAQIGDDFVELNDIECPFCNINHIVISQRHGCKTAFPIE